ncbi:MAG: Lipopolysaccharide core biosynthesis protein RfaG [Chlamydiia bacterium]|nr:Lipopolysaccharide core biosynthesis protein RfaG [Chlamydiia bacterium]MCH9615821.1 Lipopolysaccharide core biosynthesis protein RfaG [Chlamydiia bacterium]MCH9628776.1 Lipopolysaccharide core biosynthesis protein RfaG [Chlamydiia bacterium]
MTKVCILKRKFSSYGGLEKWTWRLAKEFSQRGSHVTIATSDPVNHPDPGIHFKHLTPKATASFRQIAEFDQLAKQFIEASNFDIVLGMDRNRVQTHIRAGNGVHAAYLKHRSLYDSSLKRLTHPFNPLNRVILNIEKQAFESKALHKIFTNSYMVEAEIHHHYNVPDDKIQVIHNGVEWREMEKPFSTWLEDKSKTAGLIKIDPSLYQFLFIGNGYQRKGLIPLLQALARLPTRDFHLSVIGKEKNTPYFEKLAEKLGILKNVTFFGTQKDITKFYQVSDCLVIPSYYDPFANVTVEALAMGLFVVSSKTNGGYEVLNSSTGAVIPTLADIDALKESLQTALAHPKTWIRSQNIRNSVQYLDFPNQLRELVNKCLSTS